MNENSPICASAIATVRLALNGWRTAHMNRNVAAGLMIRTMTSVPANSHGESSSDAGSSSMPDRHEEQHRERVAHRQRVRGGAQAVVRAADDHAGQERAERHRHAEDLRGSDRDAERDHQHRQREQLARFRGGHAIEHAWNETRADDRGERHERRHLEQR